MKDIEKEANSLLNNDEVANVQKVWETPQLRILPVPTKTQGGGGNKNDQDDQFYDLS